MHHFDKPTAPVATSSASHPHPGPWHSMYHHSSNSSPGDHSQQPNYSQSTHPNQPPFQPMPSSSVRRTQSRHFDPFTDTTGSNSNVNTNPHSPFGLDWLPGPQATYVQSSHSHPHSLTTSPFDPPTYSMSSGLRASASSPAPLAPPAGPPGTSSDLSPKSGASSTLSRSQSSQQLPQSYSAVVAGGSSSGLSNVNMAANGSSAISPVSTTSNSPAPLQNMHSSSASNSGATGNVNASSLDEELIPAAIVIKNIPFAIKKEQLLDVMTSMGLPLPYAFNYHFDSGVFRGLAFANFATPQETGAVIASLNGKDIGGRRLRVEYKKMLPLAERERIEREKRERRGQLEEQHRSISATPSMSSLKSGVPGNVGNGLATGPGNNNNNNNNGNSTVGGANGGSGVTSPSFMGDSGFYHGQQAPHQGTLPHHHHHHQGAKPHYAHHPHHHNNNNNNNNNPANAGGHGKVDLNDPETLEFYSQMLLFRDDKQRTELTFSGQFTSSQRKTVAVLCGQLGLHHQYTSSGLLITKAYAMLHAPPAMSSMSSLPPVGLFGSDSLHNHSFHPLNNHPPGMGNPNGNGNNGNNPGSNNNNTLNNGLGPQGLGQQQAAYSHGLGHQTFGQQGNVNGPMAAFNHQLPYPSPFHYPEPQPSHLGSAGGATGGSGNSTSSSSSLFPSQGLRGTKSFADIRAPLAYSYNMSTPGTPSASPFFPSHTPPPSLKQQNHHGLAVGLQQQRGFNAFGGPSGFSAGNSGSASGPSSSHSGAGTVASGSTNKGTNNHAQSSPFDLPDAFASFLSFRERERESLSGADPLGDSVGSTGSVGSIGSIGSAVSAASSLNTAAGIIGRNSSRNGARVSPDDK